MTNVFRSLRFSLMPITQIALATAALLALVSGHAAEGSCLQLILEAVKSGWTDTFRNNPIDRIVPRGLSPLDMPWETNPQIKFKTLDVVYEYGRVRSGKNAQLNELIQELENAQGEVRVIRTIDVIGTANLKHNGFSYFRVSSDGTPILALEASAPQWVLAHELQHFRDWKLIQMDLMSKGLKQKSASMKAEIILHSSPELVLWTESNAVRTELSTRDVKLQDPLYMRRWIYPEVSAIFHAQAMRSRHQRINSNGKRTEVECMNAAIQKAIRVRSLRVSAIESDQVTVPWTKDKGRMLREAKDLSTLKSEMGILGNPGLENLYNARINIILNELDLKQAELP